MIESLINPEQAEKKPWEAFIAGFLFTIAACILTMQMGVRGQGTGFLVVAFISIAAAPLIVRMFDIEEKKSEDKKNIIDRHDEIIQVFAFFFLSVVLASSFFFVFTGESASNMLFADQTLDLCSKGLINDPLCMEACIKGTLEGPVCSEILMTGKSIAFQPNFEDILINNLTVLALMILFSFLLGAGAVYIITWNATILGVMIAKVAEHPELYGSVNFDGNIMLNLFVAIPITLLRILPHGIFEFGGFFFGAVSGGIMSVAIIKNKFDTFTKMKFRKSMYDAGVYAVISVILIIIGAVVEVVL